MPVRRPKAGGGPGRTGATVDTSAKPAVLAVLPRAAWADSLLEETCNGQCDVVRAVRPAEARQLAARVPPDVVLWGCLTLSDDAVAPDSPALTELRGIKALHPAAEIVAIVHDHAQVRLSTYCELILMGVRCLVDADQPDAADVLAARLDECLTIREDDRQAREVLRGSPLLDDIGLVGESLINTGILPLVRRAATLSDVPVLITGETGTGKELLALAIHRLDEKRKDGPLITVNCGAIAEGLAESSLFGHLRGAFTGADANRPGYFRAADGGVLFLDEVSELSLPLQAKLLRVVEANLVMPVGQDREEPVDVRVIAATNCSLTEMVEAGTFRADLYHRLAIIRIHVPPLRDRAADIPSLVKHFLSKHAHYYGGRIDTIEPAVVRLLSAVPSPGNIRELENVVRYGLLTKRAGTVLQLSDLPPGLLRAGAAAQEQPAPADLADHFGHLIQQGAMSLTDMMDHCEQAILSTALRLTGQNRTRAAELLRTTRRTIQNKLLKHHLA